MTQYVCTYLTRLISLFHLGLPTLPFPNSLDPRVLSLPFYFTSSAVTTFFLCNEESKNSIEDCLDLTRFGTFNALHWKRDVSKRTVSVYSRNELCMIYQLFVYQLRFNFSLTLIAVINGPANRLLAQIGAKNSAQETRAYFSVEFFLCAIFHK